MRFAVSVRRAAKADIREARRWYETQRAGLGDEFLAEISVALIGLETSADQLSPYYLDYRRLIIRRFPFKIFYLVVADRVAVFRVLHSSRDHTHHLR